MTRLLVLLALLLPLPAQASESARALIDQGAYADARTVALEADTVAGLNLAAEAMAAEIMLLKIDDPKDHAKDALDLTEAALARDPDNAESLFLHALHMGFRTRSSSPLGIVMHGLVGKTHDAIAAFERAAPDDGRADALYGAWHLGIVRGAGDGRFGASLEEGMGHYDAAVAARPDDIVVMGNYAFSLIVLEDPALLPRAEALLRRIAATAPDGATEAETRARLLRLLAVIDDPQALRVVSRGLLNTEEVEE
ncbi:hypothetical protein [uncultured Algimonas sp.]|uniref:hypothetical protein n=1 Tax=uncultured Algimonas sp. TaxID=1547920 RepID=UPI0026092A4E|nr:hypothetical protein [uncultured Algimonas sp.]